VGRARGGDSAHYAAFRDALHTSLRFGDHEAVDHPVACAWRGAQGARCAVQELTHPPFPGLLVQASSLAGDPVRAFTEQFRGGNMPSSLRAGACPSAPLCPLWLCALTPPPLPAPKGYADPLLLRHHLILHDAAHPWRLAEAMQAEVSATFGASSVTVLQLNSRHTPPPPDTDTPPGPQQPAPHPVADIWSAARAARLAQTAAASSGDPVGVAPGAALTQDDVARTATFLAEFAAQLLIPFLENKVVQLSAHISATRRGLKNTLKSLWKGKEPRAIELPPDGAYPHASQEAGLRLCADLALMLRDYELAAGHLRLAAADFRADRAHRQLGGAQEALGVALACVDAPRREVEAAFEAAWSAYRAAGPGLGGRLAQRCCVAHAHAAGCLSGGRESGCSAAPLTRASFDASHGAAAQLLEASAAALAAAGPPRLRRCALHLVLAGHRHTLQGSTGGAARAYALAAPLLAGRRWHAAEAHVHASLARQLAGGGETAAALRHFCALTQSLGAPAAQPEPRAAHAHAQYMRELALLAGSAGVSAGAGAEGGADQGARGHALLASLLAGDLRLPRVDGRRVRVTAEDARGYGDARARQVGEERWATLEGGSGGAADGPPAREALIPPDLAPSLAQSGLGNWLDGGAQRAAAAEQWGACVAGEEVWLELQLHNPLAVGLAVRALRLEAVWEGEAEAGAAGEALPGPSAALSLQPGERTTCRLLLVPPRPGTLRITSAAWRVACAGQEHGDAAAAAAQAWLPGRCALDVAAPRRRRSPGGAWLRDVPLSSRLLFRVAPRQPRLTCRVEGLPGWAPQGAVLRLLLRLTNAGDVPLARLRLAHSHAGLVPGAQPLPWDAAPGDWGWAEASQPGACASDGDSPAPAAQRPPPRVFAFPEAHARLDAGQSLCWPLWLHCDGGGAGAGGLQELLLSLCYAPAAAADPAAGASAAPPRCRLLRLCCGLAVRPWLRCSARLEPASSGARLLHLTACDAAPQQRCVALAALALLPPAPAATLRPLSRASAQPLRLPADGQPASLYLALQEAREGPPGASLALGGHPQATDCDRGVLGAMQRAAGAAQEPRGSSPPHSSAAAASASALRFALLWESAATSDCAAYRGMQLLSASAHPRAAAAVRATLQGPSQVRHDFLAAPGGALAALSLHVRNAGAQAVRPRLQLLPAPPGGGWARTEQAGAHPEAPAQPLGLPVQARYSWAGVTERALPVLAPGCVLLLPVSVLLSSPGVHQLDRWRLSWSGSDAGDTSGGEQLHNPPCLVLAEQAEARLDGA